MGKKTITLDVKVPDRVLTDARNSSRCCRPNMVICAGYGEENFPFPEVSDVVQNAIDRLDDVPVDITPEATSGSKKFSKLRVRKRGESKRKSSQATGFDTGPVKLIAKLPDTSGSVDATLYAAAEGLRLMMNDGKYDAIVAERFDDHSDKVDWAREHLAALQPKFLPAIESLAAHLAQLRDLYLKSLPNVLEVLKAQNPKVPEHVLLDAAIDSLDEELSQILNVLRIWTDAFGQLRSGNYKQLEAVVFAVEQAFRLFEGAKPIGPCDDHADIKTSKYKVGNVFVARFSDQGPATLPGGRGPIGAHALEVPHDEASIISLMLVLYMHEFRHDIFHDIEGLAHETVMKMTEALQEAHDSGEVKLSKKMINVGRNRVPLIDLLKKFAADTIGEVDADIPGGISLSGPAYGINMVASFSAFNAKGNSVFDTNRLLRSGSYFSMPDVSAGQKTVQFLPHPPDYIRAYIVAAALDEIGFPKEAQYCRDLADQAVGTPIPEHIVWKIDDPKSRTRIRIPVADLKAIAPVMARTLLKAKMETLDGKSSSDLVNWTPQRQEKVDKLVQILMDGKSNIPDDGSDYYAPYVAAAATLAYWGLVQKGVRPRRAAKLVNDNALDMIDTLRIQFEEAEAAAKDAPCERDAPADETSEEDSTS